MRDHYNQQPPHRAIDHGPHVGPLDAATPNPPTSHAIEILEPIGLFTVDTTKAGPLLPWTDLNHEILIQALRGETFSPSWKQS